MDWVWGALSAARPRSGVHVGRWQSGPGEPGRCVGARREVWGAVHRPGALFPPYLKSLRAFAWHRSGGERLRLNDICGLAPVRLAWRGARTVDKASWCQYRPHTQHGRKTRFGCAKPLFRPLACELPAGVLGLGGRGLKVQLVAARAGVGREAGRAGWVPGAALFAKPSCAGARPASC